MKPKWNLKTKQLVAAQRPPSLQHFTGALTEGAFHSLTTTHLSPVKTSAATSKMNARKHAHLPRWSPLPFLSSWQVPGLEHAHPGMTDTGTPPAQHCPSVAWADPGQKCGWFVTVSRTNETLGYLKSGLLNRMKTRKEGSLGFPHQTDRSLRKHREQEPSTRETVRSSVGPVSDSSAFCGRDLMLTSLEARLKDKESERVWERKGALDPRVSWVSLPC